MTVGESPAVQEPVGDAGLLLLTASDAVSWSFPYDPRISPDGTLVAFTLRDIAKPDEHPRSSVWLADLSLAPVRRVTFGPRQDDSPRWSPDGRTLAFLSDRKEAGKLQVYVLPLSGGEASLLSDLKEGVSDLRWSPDGAYLAFLSKDPEPEEVEKRKKDERQDQVVADAEFRYTRLYVISASGGAHLLVSSSGDAHVTCYDWSPDSRRLVAVVVGTPTTDNASYGPSDLTVYSLENPGDGTMALHLEAGMDGPAWSPDGSTIAFRTKLGRVQASTTIWVVPASGGEPRCLTAELEGDVEETTWSLDGSEIRFVGFEDLWGTVGAVRVSTGQITRLLAESERREGSFSESISVSRDGSRYAVVLSRSDRPPNVFVADFGEPLKQITDLNQPLATRPFARGEPVRWRSTDGLEISGLVFQPLGAGKGPHPLVLEIHGGPAWLWSDRFMGSWHDWVQLLTCRGFAVLLPNPRGSLGRGTAFTDMEVGDIGGMELQDLLSGVDHVVEMGIADPDRLGVGGWSHGGYLTAWTITQTDRFKAAVVGAGVSNLVSDHGQNDIPGFNANYYYQSVYDDSTLYRARSPVTFARNVRTPTLILHGEKDERVTQPQGQELYRALQHCRVPVEFVTYPREGHRIEEKAHQIDLIERVVGWFERYVKSDFET